MPRRFDRSTTKTDTILTIDTSFIENYKSIKYYYNTIYDQPVHEEYVSYRNDSIVDRLKHVREYDKNGHPVYNAVFSTIRNVNEYVLNNSEKTVYMPNGFYTVYEDKFLADGKPDIITTYDSHRNMIDYKRYYSEGGFSQIKYVYRENSLLLSATFYVNGKYNGKNLYTYTFAK